MQYNPSEIESEILEFWKSSTKKLPSNAPVITMPPPNITGRLHIGHSLMLSIQDSIVRYSSMLGTPINYIPGTDHAGIATQALLQKQYAITQENRFKVALEWQLEKQDAIYDQIKEWV